MANSINNVVLTGRLTRDPELRRVNETTVCSYTLAVGETRKVNGEKQEKTSFIECVHWGKGGEIVSQYCKKGALVAVVGKLEQQRWTEDTGVNRSKLVVVVEKVEMLQTKKDSGQQPSAEPDSDDVPF